MERTKMSEQVKRNAEKEPEQEPEYEGDIDTTISTGSTLLDLAISGGRVYGGGIPSGIFVEIFGPSGCGKTVLLCEIAGAIQRQGGQVLFRDPEARLDKKFAEIFDLNMDEADYDKPDTVRQMFKPIHDWEPEPEEATHGIFTDSLAALSTEEEMDDKDSFGTERAKQFSSGFRRACRIVQNKGYLMVTSNQVRQNIGGGPFGPKYISPGGEAIPHYTSLRLRCSHPSKLREKHSMGRKTVKRPIGIQTKVTVHKSSVWKPFRTADITILFDYGIDDIRANLQFVKDVRKENVYYVRDNKLHQSLNKSILAVEEQDLEEELRKETIERWNELESRFGQKRKEKRR